jgi:hypothetical protein
MRKLRMTAVLSLIVTALTAAPALAMVCTVTSQTGGLHVCEGSVLEVTEEDGILTATGEVCGAGNRATATLSSGVAATVGCVTRSGAGEPQGLQEAETTAVGSETFQTRQGRGTFAVTTEPVTIGDFDFECPSAQQTEVIVGDITFTEPVTLTITSGQNKELTATCVASDS